MLPFAATGLLAPVDDAVVVLVVVLPEFLTVPPLFATGLLVPVDDAVVVLLAFSVLPVTLIAVLLSLALAAPPVLLLASEPVGVIVVVFPLTFVEVPPLVAADPVPVSWCWSPCHHS